MNIFLIYDGQELGPDIQKAIVGANLTLITDENSTVPSALLPMFVKAKSLNLLSLKNKDPFVLGLTIGQNYKPGDKVFSTDSAINEAIAAFFAEEPVKRRKKGKSIESKKITEPQKTTAKPSETKDDGKMPEPIEKPFPKVNIDDKEKKTDENFEKAFKKHGIDKKYKDKALELYKIATDKASRGILSKDIGNASEREKVLAMLNELKPV